MRKVFFDHIPKTGGTAVTHAVTLAAGLDASQVPDLRLLGTVHYSELIADYGHLPYIAAHCGFQLGQALAPDRLHCVLLRDPIERFLSVYAFNRHDVPIDNNRDPSVRKARELDVGEFLLGGAADPGVGSDWHVEHFLPLGWDGGPIDSPERRFRLACAGLEQYDLVGFQDSIEEFCDALCGLAGIDAAPRVARVNPTSRPLRPQDLEPQLLERLHERFAWDYRLFEHARALARAQRRSFALAFGERGEGGIRATADNVPLPQAGNETKAPPRGDGRARISAARMTSELSVDGNPLTEDIAKLSVEVEAREAIEDVTLGFAIRASSGKLMFGTNTLLLGYRVGLRPGLSTFVFGFQNRLGLGDYSVDITLHHGLSAAEGLIDFVPGAAPFRVVGTIGDPFEGQLKLFPQLVSWGFSTLQPLPDAERPVGARDFEYVSARGVPLQEFKARLRFAGEVPTLRPGDVVTLAIEIANSSQQVWSSTGLRRVTLSYQWRGADGESLVVADGLRTELPNDMPPGESRRVPLIVAAPIQPGRFVLLVSPVQEGVAWFYERETSPLRIPIDVQ